MSRYPAVHREYRNIEVPETGDSTTGIESIPISIWLFDISGNSKLFEYPNPRNARARAVVRNTCDAQ